MDSAAPLEIKLERATQIGRTNPRRRNPCADINKWNSTSARDKVVSQVRSQTDDPFTARGELGPCEQFKSELWVAAVPVVMSKNMTEQMRRAGWFRLRSPRLRI